MTEVIDDRTRRRGCLLGGAVGDALGAPIEFMTLREIRATFGSLRLLDYPSEVGEFTDDTQMTLFTAEGLIRAHARWLDRGLCHPPAVIWHAYLRWLLTQGEPVEDDRGLVASGWLMDEPELHHRRAPGTTCLTALRDGRPGRIEAPLNDSKGCGGVMRVAPVGLFAMDPFRLASEAAALTHGHPSGYLAAGAFAELVHVLFRGGSMHEAIDVALQRLARHAGHEEVSAAVTRARATAKEAPATPESVERLGGGWVAEEALAIAVFCALKADDFASGVLLAVNHSGDSDSTGSMTGNLLGVAGAVDAIPPGWLDRLQGRSIIETIADDMGRVLEFSSSPFFIGMPSGNQMTEEFLRKYPPN